MHRADIITRLDLFIQKIIGLNEAYSMILTLVSGAALVLVLNWFWASHRQMLQLHVGPK